MNESTASFVGSIPKIYDDNLGPLLFEPYALDIVDRIDKKRSQSVLEIACGTGRVTKHLRQVLPPSAKLVATDLNADMIQIAQSKLQGQNIEWKVADAQDLPFADNSFDLIVCQFGYMFVPDKPKAFAEAYRVLKKNGKLLFNTWDKLEMNRAPEVVNERICEYFANDPPVFYKTPFSMYDEDEIKSLLKEAGFHDIKIELIKKQGISPSAENAALGFVEGNPVQIEIIKKDPSLVNIIRNDIRKRLAEKFGDSPMVAPMQALVIESKKMFI